ncbi:MAG TPA: response regulator [Rhodocyclaceae bacterium]|nr:response regulator [Rhodocyclaceae bacterium]
MTRGIAHLVDDDEAIRDALAWLLRSRGVDCRSWSSAEAFLADYGSDMCGCLVLDIRMPAMSGPELFDRLLALGCTMPTIFLTGHGDVPQAVLSLKKGAFDFMEKPCNDNDLADRVIAALHLDLQRRSQAASTASIESRLQSLTNREREVMERILDGQYNKVIAADLDIAMRTVEVHRARIFEKMDVKSAVELAQLLAGNPHD